MPAWWRGRCPWGRRLPHPRPLPPPGGGDGLHEPEADRKGQSPPPGRLALAQPDDLIEGFGEHHGLLGGMLEAEIKPAWPEDFKRVIAITYRFSAGWRRVHNPQTGEEVADNLTTTEFAAAMLAARGWTNQEIAAHLRISPTR